MLLGKDQKATLEPYLRITENRSKLMAVIISMVGDLEVAEDMFQESVLEILTNIDKYDQDRDFLPWACGLARNIVRAHWRKSKKSPSLLSREILESLSDIAITGEDEDCWKDEKNALHRCLKKLPSRMQTLLYVRYARNLKGDQLSEYCKIPAGSIRTTLFRLRTKLRHCINTHIEQGP